MVTRSRREYSTTSRMASPECATASKEPIKGLVPNPIIPYLWNTYIEQRKELEYKKFDFENNKQ